MKRQRTRYAASCLIPSLLLLAVSVAPTAANEKPKLPRSEHPMPQMVRVEWLNLNGTWEFAESDRADDARYLSDQSYPDKIVVPFCRESKLSGLERPADGWIEPGFGDGGWKIGRNGFGNKMPGATPWDTKDIWLRQEFACEDPAIARALLVIHYDNGTEVYLNGKLIWKGEGWNDQYDGFDVSAKVKQSLRKGKNTIAIHCHQDVGGRDPVNRDDDPENLGSDPRP